MCERDRESKIERNIIPTGLPKRWYIYLIKVGDCDGRNNAIISELRRQNKNGKDAHCI